MAAKNTPKNGAPPGRFSVTLSGRGLAAVIVLFVICLVWTFVLGVLVGRGYKPEEAVPKLAELMPEASENASRAEADKAPEVLKPEELEFFEELQKKPEDAAQQQATAPAAKPVESPKPVAGTKTATGDQSETSDPSAAEAGSQDGSFMYIYQAAAFRSLKQAQQFQAKIQALGYSAGVESATYGGNTWHRVLVHFKGTPQETRILKESLQSLGVEKPLLRGKKPL